MRTSADRLDEAVGLIVAGDRPVSEAELRPLIRTAQLLRDALTPVPAGDAFQDRLAGRLAEPNPLVRMAGRAGDMARRRLHGRGRLIAAGAVSSAAVGVTLTAVAVWLTSRRQAAGGHRPMQRQG